MKYRILCITTVLLACSLAPTNAFVSKNFTKKIQIMQRNTYIKRIERAKQFYLAKQYNNALIEATRALGTQPPLLQQIETRILLLGCYEKLNQFEEALSQANWLIENAPHAQELARYEATKNRILSVQGR